jgi:hypothetical protein
MEVQYRHLVRLIYTVLLKKRPHDLETARIEQDEWFMELRARRMELRAGRMEFRAGRMELRARRMEFRAWRMELRARRMELRAR